MKAIFRNYPEVGYTIMANIKQIKVGDTTYNIEPYTSYLPLAGGKMTGNLQMTENSTSILLRSGSETWYSGIYANSSGDEVLGIVAVNPRTHIMLGTANPLSRPTAASLTPAIDIKNGKVGINKRLGTDGAADAGSYELDVNGAIRANGSVDANSARISNGLYVGTSITHNSNGNLVIGNSDNRRFVEFVEDVSASRWSISVDGEAEFDTISERGIALPDRYAPKEWISVCKTTLTDPALASATGSLAIGYVSTAAGPHSVAIGNGTAGTTGSVAIGYNNYANTGTSTVAIGQNCYATGNYCISVGYNAKSAQTGSIAMGSHPTASGVYSIAIGMYAKAYKDQSIVMGYQASATGTRDGNSSIVIGPSAVSYATNTADPSYQVEMGNTVIGRKASVSGFANVVVGVGDGTRHVSVSGTGNVVIAIPQQALESLTGNTLVRSNGGILIGRGSISGSAILIRNNSSAYVEYGAYLGGIGKSSYTGSSYLVLGSPSTNYCYKTSAGSSWTSASDIRDKTDIQSLTGGLEFLSKITPITYVENPRTRYSEDNDKTYDKEAHKLGTKKGVRRIAGVNAQETYAVQQEIYGTDNYGAVVDWSRHDHPDEEEFDRYWVQYERFVPYLIDAVKTLNKKVCELEKEIENLKSS